MKKSKLITLLIFLLVIPITLFLGTKIPGRGYYITGTLIIIEMLIPFFLAFEGRRVQARELVLLAVMCALAIVGRVAIPLPHFKAIFAIIMLTGIAFGPESGFMVGAIAALASNFFYGQGHYTPWQMMAYGAVGLLAGFCFRGKDPLKRNPWTMAIFGFLTVLFVAGPIMDCSGIFLMLSHITLKTALLTLASGMIYANLSQAICTAICILLMGRPLLERLDRIQRKYGIME